MGERHRRSSASIVEEVVRYSPQSQLGHKAAHDKIKDYLVREFQKSPKAVQRLTQPVSATDSLQSTGLPSLGGYVGSSLPATDETDSHVIYDEGED